MEIKTKKDIIEWANNIMAGEGKAYIPLSKSGMYAVASLILELWDKNKETAAGREPPKSSPEVGEVQEQDADWGLDAQLDAQDDFATTSITDTQHDGSVFVTMPRGNALHHEGLTAQAAYDRFLKWSKDNPKEGMVMDFSTGTKSANAAFAYWLMKNVVVELPSTTTTIAMNK